MPDLLSVEAARNLVIRHARRLPGVPAHAFQSGDVLAEDIHADIDLPPFHKSLVDGYAVPMEDCGDAPARILTLLETVHAGEVPKHALQPGHCTLVMTGAPLPEGAAAVVMIEKSRTLDDGRIELSGPINPGQNRLEQGGELRSRELVFKKHTLLKPAHIGVLASIGRLTGATVQRALASVVSTGDELVPPEKTPGPGQIRNSNGYLLTELLAALGAATLFERHVPDNTERLVETFKSRLHGPDAVETNLLVVTGGVSAGQRDLVPAALKDAGVTPIFHKVALRPGKPLWFGVGPENNFGAPCLVFGLPGNPVSGLVCALLFIKPAIEVMSGRKPSPLIPTTAMLAEPYKHSGDRMSFLPALRVSDAIEVSRWSGSSDLRTVANADGFAVFDPGAQLYPRGHKVGFIPLPG